MYRWTVVAVRRGLVGVVNKQAFCSTLPSVCVAHVPVLTPLLTSGDISSSVLLCCVVCFPVVAVFLLCARVFTSELPLSGD